jgi:hypothetical protein
LPFHTLFPKKIGSFVTFAGMYGIYGVFPESLSLMLLLRKHYFLAGG